MTGFLACVFGGMVGLNWDRMSKPQRFACIVVGVGYYVAMAHQWGWL